MVTAMFPQQKEILPEWIGLCYYVLHLKLLGMEPTPKTFVQKLIKLAFKFGNNKELFYERFVESVDVDTLKEYQIIDVDIPPELTEKEAELYSLIKAGFTPEELCVIYGTKNLNAIYIKRHRLNKKLKGSCSVEILVVILAVLVVMAVIICI